MKKITLLLFAVIALSGCQIFEQTSSISADITVFYDMEYSITGKTIAIVPKDNKKIDSQEFKSYASILKLNLNKIGFKVVKTNENPDFIALFDYGIDNGQQQIETYTMPKFGIIGYYDNGFVYTTNIYRYHYNRVLIPKYGMIYETGITSQTTYSSYINIDIAKTKEKSLHKIYEGTAKTKSQCSKMTFLVPKLLEIYFSQFPRQNGVTTSETMTWKDRC